MASLLPVSSNTLAGLPQEHVCFTWILITAAVHFVHLSNWSLNVDLQGKNVLWETLSEVRTQKAARELAEG